MADPQSPIPNPLFDRALVRQRRVLPAHDFLRPLMAERLRERMDELGRPFARALVMGGDASLGSVAEEVIALPVDEEWLPFAPGSFDLILSVGRLHWVNDVPGALAQLRAALKPGGLFLAVFPGGSTLHELREAITQAAIAREEGLAARVSPFIDAQGAASLLQRAGFKEPVADSEIITARYADAFALMRELRGMGEANALLSRPKHFTRRGTMQAIAEQYARLYAGKDGRIPATFELVGMTGWK